jgi:uncharacterized protein (TIGR02996 family)
MSLATTLHPEELLLLRAVCAEPDDDTARLIAADWYEETEEPLLVAFARFIRRSVADARLGIQDKNDADDPSNFLAGSASWKRERAKSALVASIAVDRLRDNAGNHWAARLFRRQNAIVSGYCKPSKWDRGFPARVSFTSYSQWIFAAKTEPRGARFYERVPVLETNVGGRSPGWFDWQRDDGMFCYWNRREVYTGRMNKSNLAPDVFVQLSAMFGTYPWPTDARADACKAFTDAGRVACGFAPRHNKGKAVAKKAASAP